MSYQNKTIKDTVIPERGYIYAKNYETENGPRINRVEANQGKHLDIKFDAFEIIGEPANEYYSREMIERRMVSSDIYGVVSVEHSNPLQFLGPENEEIRGDFVVDTLNGCRIIGLLPSIELTIGLSRSNRLLYPKERVIYVPTGKLDLEW